MGEMVEWQASRHPLVAHWTSELRDQSTNSQRFRSLVGSITQVLITEATKDLVLETRRIETPLEVISAAPTLKCRLSFVSIMRAGNAMLEAALDMLELAEAGHIGLYRKEVGKPPVEYFCKLPSDIASSEVFLLDPMLATASSAISAIQKLEAKGVRKLRFLCLVAAPEGLERLKREIKIPVQVFCAAIDRELNSKAYILPGLGDAGDRIYGTPHDA